MWNCSFFSVYNYMGFQKNQRVNLSYFVDVVFSSPAGWSFWRATFFPLLSYLAGYCNQSESWKRINEPLFACLHTLRNFLVVCRFPFILAFSCLFWERERILYIHFMKDEKACVPLSKAYGYHWFGWFIHLYI